MSGKSTKYKQPNQKIKNQILTVNIYKELEKNTNSIILKNNKLYFTLYTNQDNLIVSTILKNRYNLLQYKKKNRIFAKTNII